MPNLNTSTQTHNLNTNTLTQMHNLNTNAQPLHTCAQLYHNHANAQPKHKHTQTKIRTNNGSGIFFWLHSLHTTCMHLEENAQIIFKRPN